jgi:hypothetical protein
VTDLYAGIAIVIAALGLRDLFKQIIDKWHGKKNGCGSARCHKERLTPVPGLVDRP